MCRQTSVVCSVLATHCIFRTVVNYLQVNFSNAGIVLCSSESTRRQKAKYKNILADIPQRHALTLIHKVKQKRFTRSTNVAILCICNDDLHLCLLMETAWLAQKYHCLWPPQKPTLYYPSPQLPFSAMRTLTLLCNRRL